MGQQIVNGKERVPGGGADGHLNDGTVFEGHNTVELQRYGDPLVLADAAIVMRLEEGQLRILIEGAGLQVQPGRVDVGSADLGALVQRLAAHHSQHNGLAPVGAVDLISGSELHAADQRLESPGLGQGNGGIHRLPLRHAAVQELLVVL